MRKKESRRLIRQARKKDKCVTERVIAEEKAEKHFLFPLQRSEDQTDSNSALQPSPLNSTALSYSKKLGLIYTLFYMHVSLQPLKGKYQHFSKNCPPFLYPFPHWVANVATFIFLFCDFLKTRWL